MTERKRCGAMAGAVLLAVVVCAGSLRAAEAPIDLFSDASMATQYIPDTNVAQDTIGSTVRVDPGLTGVIGQVRQLTVTAAVLMIPGLDDVVAGVSAAPLMLFQYASSAGAVGSIELRYDRNGSGLNAFLAFAQGIRVTIAAADLACVTPGLDVTVTLTDGNLTTAAVTQTVLLPVTPGTPLALDFAFSDFAGVDPSDLFGIQIAVQPEAGELGGCDLELSGTQTFGTPPNETICDDGIDNNNNGLIDCKDPDCFSFPGCPSRAPALSPSGIAIAFAVLALLGVSGIAQRRRSRRELAPQESAAGNDDRRC